MPSTPVEKLAKKLNGDEKAGAEIVARRLEKPVRTIAENSGQDGAVVADEVRAARRMPISAINANTGEYVDMFKAGIIDPTKVTRSALQNAASIAGSDADDRGDGHQDRRGGAEEQGGWGDSVMTSKRDYYEVLGVSKDAGADDLKRAYRVLAMKYHPDRNSGDESAAVHFKEAAEAYDVLSDAEKRARYDRYGHAGLQGTQMPDFSSGASIFDMFGDLLGGIFGDRGSRGPQRGEDLLLGLEVTLAEAYRGCTKTITYPREETCGECRGSGARAGSQAIAMPALRWPRRGDDEPGIFSHPANLSRLRRAGVYHHRSVPHTARAGPGSRVQRTLQIEVPAGVDVGNRQLPPLHGEGNAGEAGAPRGDFYFDLRIPQHPLFQRDGDHLICQVPISVSQAALGGPIEVPTLDGSMTHELKRGHQSHETIRIYGKGMVNRRSGRRGDLIAVLLVETPTHLTKRQEELFRELAEIDKKHVSPHRKTFFDKIRSVLAPRPMRPNRKPKKRKEEAIP